MTLKYDSPKNHAFSPIAVVGMSCRYPDAENCQQLWENILARRRAFRKMPSERLPSDYFTNDKKESDLIYTNKVAVLKDYHFDRNKFKIPGSSYRTADLAHWLALEVADESMASIVSKGHFDFPKRETAVFVGNTLTGEFSRASVMRVRWPYVAKVITSQLREEGRSDEEIGTFLLAAEKKYKSSFPVMEEDSLAGGLSNTIAGRICNYYDFKGGGYTVDGACSSSLLAVNNACSAITNKDCLVALAGGVDLSLDPFELVGFSRAGALATNEMLVYDEHSRGFWPGEGCGFVVLADYEYALENNMNILALIKGWGISSDGHGGLTRPDVDGQFISFERAYKKAGYSVSSLSYLEGHGTGTRIGDATELGTMMKGLTGSSNQICIGSLKANIGHTKAAAGIGGLIKSILVLNKRIIPPASGFKTPNSKILSEKKLKLPSTAIIHDSNSPMRVGVSAMGFGGINAHITLEESPGSSSPGLSDEEKILLSSHQDSELFLYSDHNKKGLVSQLSHHLTFADKISLAELSDLSQALYKNLKTGLWKLAIVCDTPDKLASNIGQVLAALDAGASELVNERKGIFLSKKKSEPNITLLFPGQGSRPFRSGDLLEHRLPALFDDVDLELHTPDLDNLKTAIAQPANVSTALLGLGIINQLNIDVSSAIGHSLGELSAMHWAGIMGKSDLIEIARRRGRLMDKSTEIKGSMLSIPMSPDELTQIVDLKEVSIAGINAENQTVISGKKHHIEDIRKKLESAGIASVPLKVENAFHSTLMNSLIPEFEGILNTFKFNNPVKKIYSTISGDVLDENADVKDLLVKQLVEPVNFYRCAKSAADEADLWIELGGGPTLLKLINEISEAPAISLDLRGNTVKGILKAAGALFAFNAEPTLNLLFENRFTRDFDLNWNPSFLINPCELFKLNGEAIAYNGDPEAKINSEPVANDEMQTSNGLGTVDIELQFIRYLAKEIDLPQESLLPGHRMLDDLHLNSLNVGQLVADFAEMHQLKITRAPTEYANASIEEIVHMLQASDSDDPGSSHSSDTIPGLFEWVNGFIIQKEKELLPSDTEIISNGLSKWEFIPITLERQDFYEFKTPEGDGLLISLIDKSEKETLDMISELQATVKNQAGIIHLVVIQSENLFSGFCKSLFLENPRLKVTVINTPLILRDEIIGDEITITEGFAEVFYDKNGMRSIPFITPVIQNTTSSEIPIDENDVVLVTGGGKGITANCVRALAQKHEMALVLVGRSDPDKDNLLEKNLSLLSEAGIVYQYHSVDITNMEALRKVIVKAEQSLGRITGFIHGAGINAPKLALELTREDILKTLSPKVYGFRNIMEILDPGLLKFIISFGSIIARSGMAGNADYALANEWLGNDISCLAQSFESCQVYNLEWSVWSGAGMGEKLDVLDNMLRKGIHPISLDKGIELFLEVFESTPPGPNVIYSGRYGSISTLTPQSADIPFLRYLEDVKLHYPSLELIAEFTLTSGHDLYMKDHKIDGQMVLPAVYGLEAMSQAAATLAGEEHNFTIRNARFDHPIILSDSNAQVVRIVAQRKDESSYSVALRSSSTAFQLDHFTADVVFHAPQIDVQVNVVEKCEPFQFDVSVDLYNSLLFHGEAFQKIESYTSLTPYSCCVKAHIGDYKSFSDFSPSSTVLPHPTVRDAFLHAVQPCVPDYMLLPVSVKNVLFYRAEWTGQIEIRAKELEHVDDLYTYNIHVLNANGHLLEVWNEIVFKRARALKDKSLSKDLGRLIIQRRIDEHSSIPGSHILMFHDFDHKDHVLQRDDGKPIVFDGRNLSKSHLDETIITTVAKTRTAIDIERVNNKTENQWLTLLNEERFSLAKFVSETNNESISTASTRVWGAMECIRKYGLGLDSPIHFHHTEGSNELYLQTGDHLLLSYLCHLKEFNDEVVFSIIVES